MKENIKKNSKWILVAAVVAALAIFFPGRSHPGEEGYRAEHFRFEDFDASTLLAKNKQKRLDEVLREIIPLGTEKNEVDEILLNSANASVYENFPRNYTYSKDRGGTNLSAWIVNVEFDEEMKSKSLRLPGNAIY